MNKMLCDIYAHVLLCLLTTNSHSVLYQCEQINLFHACNLQSAFLKEV